MKKILAFIFILPLVVLAQEKDSLKTKTLKANIQQYKTFTLQKDTIVIDTSLTLQDEYRYNYLRKDIFGLLPFSNEGYLYTNLSYTKKANTIQPQFGFSAKHVSYIENDAICYYQVPTPLTDLYFKTVMRQGQSLDALLSVNTKPNLNFTIAYKSIRSIGDYFNNLTSSGHFRFITNYQSKNKKYLLHANFVGQDILNQENGGVNDLSQLDGKNLSFKQRERVEVYFNDAYSKLKGNRYFIDHSYQLKQGNGIMIKHQMYYENKFFEFIQGTSSTRLGTSLYPTINNKTNYAVFYNKAAISYVTRNFGEINFFIDNFNTNQFYKKPLETTYISPIPYNYHVRTNNIGGQYNYNHLKWNFNVLAQNSITKTPASNYEATAKYTFTATQFIKLSAQQTSKIPDNIYNYSQSDYANYNWINSFKNQQNTNIQIQTQNKWLHATVQISNISNYLYFYNTLENIATLAIKPLQYHKAIQYFSAEIEKEVKVKNWALHNTIQYQNVEQGQMVLNVPQFITRNTLYYTKPVFKKAMLLQTGVTFNYFTKYYANDYIPVIGEFYSQSQTKIGGFPMLDFFVNARVQQCRIYLKAEHINALFTNKVTYYNAPNYPFRDFHIRFGLEWNFFR